MTAKVMKIEKRKSVYGGDFYYLFCKNIGTGKSYRSCLSSKMGNFQRWRVVIDKFNKNDREVVLDGLIIIGKGLIDADSMIVVK